MADLQPVQTSPAEPGFPDHSMLTIYADAVLNLSPSAQVMKFFLARSDPNFNDLNAYKYTPVAQVVMSMQGFLQTAAFFEKSRGLLLASKVITQDQIDAAQAPFGVG